MEQRAGRAIVWARALVLAAVAWAMGIAGHVAAGGLLPETSVLVLLLLATAGVAAPLLGRERSGLQVTALLVAGQTGIHVLLTALSGHPGAHTGHPSAGHATYDVGQMWPHVLEDLTRESALMALGHLAAALVVGCWLAAGERAIWTLVRIATRPVTGAVRAILAAAPWSPAAFAGPACAATPRPAWRVVEPALAVLADAVHRRGPPLAVV